jgi:hypothetical protein
MSHPQMQNGQTNQTRDKIKMTPPVKGTFAKSKAKLTTMLKSNRATQKKNAPKAK